MIKNLIAKPTIFLVVLSFFYLQACDSGNTGTTATTVDSSTLKKETTEEKKDIPVTAPEAPADSSSHVTAPSAIAKVENAELANKTRISPNKKADAKEVAEKPETAPKPDHASIEAGKNLLTTSDCLACHKIQEKAIGPAYADIAKKYPESEANIQLLANKVISGGSGVWGQVPMAPHPSLQTEDVKKMVMYILSLN